MFIYGEIMQTKCQNVPPFFLQLKAEAEGGVSSVKREGGVIVNRGAETGSRKWRRRLFVYIWAPLSTVSNCISGQFSRFGTLHSPRNPSYIFRRLLNVA